jgi:hypothetical protein
MLNIRIMQEGRKARQSPGVSESDGYKLLEPRLLNFYKLLVYLLNPDLSGYTETCPSMSIYYYRMLLWSTDSFL